MPLHRQYGGGAFALHIAKLTFFNFPSIIIPSLWTLETLLTQFYFLSG